MIWVAEAGNTTVVMVPAWPNQPGLGLGHELQRLIGRER